MNLNSITEEFTALPMEAQQQVADLIACLKRQYSVQKNNANKTRLTDEVFVGIWKDREDMRDSTAWVKGLRDREWNQ